MKAVSAAKMAAQFSDYLEASQEQPLLVTRNGKPIAVLLAVQNEAEAEQLALGHARSLRSIFQEAHKQIDQGDGVPNEQFWKQVESRRGKQKASQRGRK